MKTESTNKSLGICIGASTISFVKTQKAGDAVRVISCESIIHHGNPKSILADYFRRPDSLDSSVVATGRKFKHLLNTVAVSEPEAIEEALRFLGLDGRYNVIASLGGENFIIYALDKSGIISNALTGSKCASGTGEFFLQQIGRMDLNVEQAVEISKQQASHAVSGRCSVFCKSDCTHALNKGIPKGEVVAGLCQMIAGKVIELLSKQRSKKLLVIGGVSQNDSVIEFLKKEYRELYIPKEAPYFEALGASLIGLKRKANLSAENIFRSGKTHFSFLAPLSSKSSNVIFKSLSKENAKDGDICILGLDVGSTTTKAVIIRTSDNAFLASVYLRTNGDPVGASVNCYRELKRQITADIRIIGLGVTGSGRHIAGLHALTNGVINEIIAHAAAAAYFDRDVDTIFEIGGQDAKYTFLTNGVASDYAMNEACSAGTGSFLEESAKETLNIDYREIGDIALKAKTPPNFNDQCAAFISSDIKTALQEGLSKEDVVAGLVYSICINYINRVKGNRPVGNKVFMQGGVCYNRAVPVAMSILVNKQIVVPPEPGLMGAFGVALEVKNRIDLGLMTEQEFTLDALINREFKYSKEFTCSGGTEKCDRKCPIAMVEVCGQKHPFGGACSKYYNQRLNIKTDLAHNDYVRIRQDLVFKKYVSLPPARGKSIGITKSFMTNTLYPLYYNFFTQLGFRVILSEKIKKEGVDKIQSAFCFPVEIAHGLFQDLLDKKPDYIFLPHIIELDNPSEKNYKKACVFVQGESYYLKTAFKNEPLPRILNPVINFSWKEKEIIKVFTGIAQQLGKSKKEAVSAYRYAAKQQEEMFKEFKVLGGQALKELEKDKNKIAMVLFGRSYNSFVEEANMGIPHKFSSKGITIIPHDFLSSEHLESHENMYWFSGQQIMRSARFIKDHEQLFGTFITNFSCGPDSFIIDYFRKIMGSKPSLTLELDSHSADVGIETRIDAALDIIKNYIELSKKGKTPSKRKPFKALEIPDDLSSPEVELLIPSMGQYGSQALSAVFRSLNINSLTLPIPTAETLKLGRNHASCKECLPFILLAGSMVEYAKERRNGNKKTLFFLPTGCGPCRLGQYAVKMKDIINDLELKNLGRMTLSDEDSYSGLGIKFMLRAWVALIISDLVHDIENTVLALAVDKSSASRILKEEWEKMIATFEKRAIRHIFQQLEKMASSLSKIELKEPLNKAKIIALTGEIYVRREEFSKLDLIPKLAEKGFVVKIAPACEYFYYCNYLARKGSKGLRLSRRERLKITFVDRIQMILEKKAKNILSRSNLVKTDLIDVDKTMKHASHLISEDLLGEGILTVGLSLREIAEDACGVITIGPFACMPSRLAESILNVGMSSLPYLNIETDGNVYPQIIQSKMEIFMLQAERFHQNANIKS